MRGLAHDISPAYGPVEPFTRQVVGVAVASGFPEPGLIRATLQKGQAHDPDTVWVVRARDRGAISALEDLGYEYVELPLVSYWKVEQPVQGPIEKGRRSLAAHVLCDVRRVWRDAELVLNCSVVLVFVKPERGALEGLQSSIPGRVRFITRGDIKPRPRKGRKIA